MGRACKNQEETMTRIITPADLQGRSLAELQALHHSVQQELMLTAPGSIERRKALASLEALSLAIGRHRGFRGPGL